MHKKFLCFIIYIIALISPVFSEETKFILHDRCINLLYKPAREYFKNTDVFVIRDARGIVLRFGIKPTEKNYDNFDTHATEKLKKIGDFLAKIKNPVIIEVHIEKFSNNNPRGIKNWEMSAVIAGNIENTICSYNNLLKNRIHSVGYGEFLPENNTPNNGGKLFNRVDIIILCNISGE